MIEISIYRWFSFIISYALKMVLKFTPFSIWWNIFRVPGPVCGEFTGHWWIPRTKASDAELWCFFFICAWINGWANTREAGDLRCHRAYYDVIVMTMENILHVRVSNVYTDVNVFKKCCPGRLITYVHMKLFSGCGQCIVHIDGLVQQLQCVSNGVTAVLH